MKEISLPTLKGLRGKIYLLQDKRIEIYNKSVVVHAIFHRELSSVALFVKCKKLSLYIR